MQRAVDRPRAPGDDVIRSEILVLLVSARPFDEALRRAFAADAGIAVRRCDGTANAIDVAEAAGATVILHDLVPGPAGLPALSAYRANAATRDLPLVVYATAADPTPPSVVFALGARDYLRDLAEPAEALARVRVHGRARLIECALAASRALVAQQARELAELSHVDALTGLANRRAFDDFAELHWRQAARDRCEVSVLAIAIDEFAGYESASGGDARDELLRRVGAIVRAGCKRPIDLPARLDGDRFGVFLLAAPHGARTLGQTLRRAVAAAEMRRGGASREHVTISVGGSSTIPRRDDAFAALARAAETALAEAARSGDRVIVRDAG